MSLPDHARENKAAWEAEAAIEWARRWPIEDLWTARLSDAAPR